MTRDLPVKISETELAPHLDLDGETIAVGQAVRSYDFAFGLKGNSRPLGMEDKGERASWIEGIVHSIGEEIIEGCPRYKIEVVLRRRGAEVKERGSKEPQYVYPPVNGTRSTMGGVTCGVTAIQLPDDWDNHGYASYMFAPESKIDDFFGDEKDMLEVNREGDKWWLGSQYQIGSEPYDSEDEAKSAAAWDARLALVTQEERLLEESGLGEGWHVDMFDGISFREDSTNRAICGENSAGKPIWTGWEGDNVVTKSYPTILEVYEALLMRKAA